MGSGHAYHKCDGGECEGVTGWYARYTSCPLNVWEIFFNEAAGCMMKKMVLVAVDILGVLNTVFAVFPPSLPLGFYGFKFD